MKSRLDLAVSVVHATSAERELRALNLLAAGRLRIVHKQRRRTLKRKGVRVWWHEVLEAYVWAPGSCLNAGSRLSDGSGPLL